MTARWFTEPDVIVVTMINSCDDDDGDDDDGDDACGKRDEIFGRGGDRSLLSDDGDNDER